MKTNRLMLALGAAALVAAAVGCERQDGIRTYSAPKDPQPAPASVASSADKGSEVGEGGGIHFTAAPEWKPLGATGMSVSTYRVSDGPPPIDLTVTPLPASAGDVLGNVNRWRGQLGMSATTEGELSKDATAVKVAGQDAHLVDLTGPNPAPEGKPQQRMLAAIVPMAGRVWFFKIAGAADKVGPQKAAFEAAVKSAHIDGPGEAHAVGEAAPAPVAQAPGDGRGSKPAAAAGDAPAIEGIASYKLPEGWRVDPNPRAMRAATIIVGEGGQAADLAVTRLGANFGDKLSNINRWRAQAGLPPVKDAGEAAGQDVTLDQGPAVIYDFAGPEGQGAGRKRLVVAMTQFPNAQTVWFFRLLGPHDVVAKNKPAFEAFVKSLKFADK